MIDLMTFFTSHNQIAKLANKDVLILPKSVIAALNKKLSTN